MSAPVTTPTARLALLSLGCAKNLVDSERLVGALTGAGFSLVERLDGADIALVNTCGFIEAAKEESIDNCPVIVVRDAHDSNSAKRNFFFITH